MAQTTLHFRARIDFDVERLEEIVNIALHNGSFYMATIIPDPASEPKPRKSKACNAGRKSRARKH